MSIGCTQTFIGPGSIGNLLGQTVLTKAAQLGVDVGRLSLPALDAAFTSSELAVVDSAVTAGGTAALGMPITWGAVAVVGGAALVAGSAYCLTVGCDVSAILQATGLPMGQVWAPPSGSGTHWNLFGTSTPTGSATPLYSASFHNVTVISSSQSDAANSAFRQGYVTYPPSIYGVPSGPCYGLRQYGGANSFLMTCDATKQAGWAVLITSNETAFVVPSGGLNCSSDMFTVPGSSGTLSCSEATAMPQLATDPPAGQSSPFKWGPTSYDSYADAEPFNPSTLANLANQVASHLDPSSGISLPQGSITAADVQQVELADRFTPNLGDMFGTPVAEQSVVVYNSSGQLVPSVAPNPSSMATTIDQMGNTLSSQLSTSTALKTAAPCGNTMAGQSPCSTIIDAPWYQWMDQETDETSACTSLAVQTAACTLTQLQTMTRTKTMTATKTMDLTDTLTNPKTVVQTLTKTQTATMQELDTPVTPTSPNIPPITLPFNEWPQVFNQFNNTNFPDFSGTCPTVSVYSTTLKTQIKFDGQCLIMDALKPYMAYVLPPTYLFMALLLIMGG